jgi:CheY-like chemotaxis protein
VNRAVVWIIDDLEANHHLVRRSLPKQFEDACELVCWLSAERALDALDDALSFDEDSLPDVIFMDFFLGGVYGTEVTVEVRKRCARGKRAGPFIVGHSSAYPASVEIVKAGGDVAIEKDRDDPVSPGVKGLFPDLDALRKHAGRARRATT